MTVGVGFRCIDGIVICADTQITFPQSHKYFENKTSFHFYPGAMVGFTYAGNPMLMGSFAYRFLPELEAGLSQGHPSVPLVHCILEDVLEDMNHLETDPDGLEMLCGIVTPAMKSPQEQSQEGTALLITNRQIVKEAGNVIYIGVGDSSLLRFLRGLFSSREFTVKQALTLGTYIVLLAKTYIEGCGGETTAIVMGTDGKLSPVSGSLIAGIEKRFLPLQERLVEVVYALYREGYTKGEADKDLEAEIQQLVKTVWEERGQFEKEIIFDPQFFISHG
jgi:hypothetical protein